MFIYQLKIQSVGITIYPAIGFACIVTLFILVSATGLKFFGLTGSFSNSSSASKPSITL